MENTTEKIVAKHIWAVAVDGSEASENTFYVSNFLQFNLEAMLERIHAENRQNLCYLNHRQRETLPKRRVHT
jgi:hypothetical protein